MVSQAKTGEHLKQPDKSLHVLTREGKGQMIATNNDVAVISSSK